MWRLVTRLFVVGWICSVCCMAALLTSPVAALGEGSSSVATPAGEGSGAHSSLEGPLVTPGSPVQGEQAQAGEEAKLANPNAVAEREASQTKYAGLDGEQATHVDGEAFPGVVNEPAGGPPKLPAGQSITAFPAGNVASVELAEGKHGVVESLEPMAVEGSSGQRVPIDLGLSEAGVKDHRNSSELLMRIPHLVERATCCVSGFVEAVA